MPPSIRNTPIKTELASTSRLAVKYDASTGSSAGGNRIAVAVWEAWTGSGTGLSITSVVDNKGQTYTQADNDPGFGGLAFPLRACVFYVDDVAGGVTTVTVTFANSANAIVGTLAELVSPTGWQAGVAQRNFSHQTFGSAPATPSPGGVTTTATSGIAIIAMTNDCSSSSEGLTAPAGWTALATENNNNTFQAGQAAYKVLTSAQTLSPQWSITGLAGDTDSLIVVFAANPPPAGTLSYSGNSETAATAGTTVSVSGVSGGTGGYTYQFEQGLEASPGVEPAGSYSIVQAYSASTNYTAAALTLGSWYWFRVTIKDSAGNTGQVTGRVPGRGTAHNYYIDPALGSDANPGTAPGSGNAWATLPKLQSWADYPGDTYSLGNGSTYALGATTLTLSPRGTAAAPVTYTSYDTGGGAEPARVVGAGDQSVIRITDSPQSAGGVGTAVQPFGNFTITNWDVSSNAWGTEGDRTTLATATFPSTSTASLIEIQCNGTGGSYPGVTLDNCVLHNGYYAAVSLFVNDATSSATAPGGLKITRCTVHDVAQYGIIGVSKYFTGATLITPINAPVTGGSPGDGNWVYNVWGDGRVTNNGYPVYWGDAQNGDVSYNLIQSSGANNTSGTSGGPVGIECVMGTGFTVRYNEVDGVSDGSAVDGDGIDFTGMTHSSITGNYVHDCSGRAVQLGGITGLVLTDDIHVRYNVCVGNAWNVSSPAEIGLADGAPTGTSYWYNNTVVLTVSAPAAAVFTAESGMSASVVKGYNNVFVITAGTNSEFFGGTKPSITLDYNRYYRVGVASGSAVINWFGANYTGFIAYQSGAAQETHGSYGDPGLVALGDHTAYSLASPAYVNQTAHDPTSRSSPVVNAGVLLSSLGISDGGLDFHGRSSTPGGVQQVGAVTYPGLLAIHFLACLGAGG